MSRQAAKWLFGASGVLGSLLTPAFVWYSVRHGLFLPPYGGAATVFSLLFLTSLACLAGAWRPTRWLAVLATVIFFGLGLLIAPSTGGAFQVVAVPVGWVAVAGIKPPSSNVTGCQ